MSNNRTLKKENQKLKEELSKVKEQLKNVLAEFKKYKNENTPSSSNKHLKLNTQGLKKKRVQNVVLLKGTKEQRENKFQIE